ncbi:uncharacterized protein ATC70_010815 [Mucor velutinosus]|uniref:Velvet domain-containing protein n=1 Tax=Mucor velutinosus TaxID=708070 RepID=A0AAN7I132_9FUNG|nr:hypothetical protein ATC70_010815 [Mucor velutinosus]
MKENQKESMNVDIYQQQHQEQEQQRNQQEDIRHLLSTGLDFNQSLQQQDDQIDANTYFDACSDSLMQHFIQDHTLYVQRQNTSNDAYLNILNDASIPTLHLMPLSNVSNVTNANTKEDSTHQQDQPKVRGEQDVFNELLQMAASASSTNNTSSNSSWLNEYNESPLENSVFITKNDEPKFFDDSFLSSRTGNIHLKPLESNMSNIQSINTPLTPMENDSRIYNLEIVQQPERARMCGFGDKDRRPISPPPILKLSVLTKNGIIIDPETFDVSFLVVTCDAHQQFETSDAAENLRNVKPKIDTIPTVAIDEKGREQYSAVRMRNLAGATVASAEKLYDLDGNLGIFFIFQDISLRIEGVFKLEFSLVDIENPPFLHCVNTHSASPVLKTIETKPFTSFTPKNFPGVVQSTPLSECFAKQGVKIPVRKEKAKKQNKKVFSTAQFLSDMDKDC